MKKQIVNKAVELGFISCRITSADPFPPEHLIKWLNEGRHGTMHWLERNPESRCDPKSLLPGAKSVICCAHPYDDHGLAHNALKDNESKGERKARFVRGADYHKVVSDKLVILAAELKNIRADAKTKCCVDTSPVLEKALGQRAGIGWIGKNMLLINPHFGSWFVLGEVITNVEIEPDPPLENRCGDCRLCLDRCPTGALDGFSLDARRCISYLTIEHRGPIDSDVEPHLTKHIYGCDHCQEVCPYNCINHKMCDK